MPIDILAIITPKPGKADRFEEAITKAAAAVKENEPGVLRYHVQRDNKGDDSTFFVLETYKDKAALDAHGKAPHFREFGRTLKKEGLVAGPPKVYFTKAVGGYASKL
ncbi:ABM-domain-containing protein [Sporormia fimetaria CBS 119925]|uniref:ABM-domain-containing protein n=1 Tax=Sporormia fimetaria CBS 119925 TaxID=1340428 RepID=A0A6A6UXF1_9PLEO|nr:ABM-domain-containing protein [Sporormia fimetaria CBS 119925]